MAYSDFTWGYRRIVILLVSLVVVPTILLLAIGVLLLVLRAQANLVFGILVLALSGAATTGVILVAVFLRKEANLAGLQSDFVSKVSHELRTPLTSIRLFSETLQRRRGDRAAEDKCIEGLERESRRLQALIDRLLDWGSMESGRREYKLGATSVEAVLEESLAAFETLPKKREVELTVQPSAVPLPLRADQGALADAVLNLLMNAFKYGGEPVRIRVASERRGRHARLSIEDNGIGIAKIEHSRIFQKFYRVDDRLSREREGSGLGLAIVKHVVRAHGGHVELVSEPGRGSTFTIVLPVGEP